MSMATPPSSGLSLIIHTLIIGVACAGRLIGRHVPQSVSDAVAIDVPESVMDPIKRVISIGIIVTLVTLTIIFAGTALTTGIREGSQEAHMRYIGETVSAGLEGLRNGLTTMPMLFTEPITYERPVSYLDLSRCNGVSDWSVLCIN